MSKDANGIGKFLRRHRAIGVFLLVVLGAGSAAAWYLQPKPVVHEFAQVERRDIKQEVSVTGRVKPSEEVSLAFEKGGRVSGVYAKVGSRVQSGAVLARLENRDALAKIDEAKARLLSEEAKLRQMKQGTRSEEIDVQKIKLANAKIVFENTAKSLLVVMDDAYTKADDAIRNKTDTFFINPRTANPQINFFLNDSGLQNDIEHRRADIEKMFTEWTSEKQLSSTRSSGATKTRLMEVKIFLDKCALALSTALPGAAAAQSVIDGYKTDVSVARTNINAAISALDAAEQSFNVAEANVTLEESNLALKTAPAEVNTISAQESVVAQAQANVRSFEAEIEKTILRAPISGTVVKQDVKQGEIVSPNAPLVSIISKSKLEIEAFIPEADIAKITIGDNASTTLDAYGDTVLFGVKVVSIDPAETLIEGVATYKTTFQFNEDDARVKSGMTANVDILTEQKDAVLALPQRVLTRKENAVFAQVLNGVELRDIPVEIGLRGSDGYVEIISGLTEGQQIVVSKN
jgi:RND family efflux transporter MFP subunit